MRVISVIMPCIGAMLLPYKFCPINILINLVEFQLKQMLCALISAIINLVPIYVLTFRENIPYIVACFLLVRFHLLPV